MCDIVFLRGTSPRLTLRVHKVQRKLLAPSLVAGRQVTNHLRPLGEGGRFVVVVLVLFMRTKRKSVGEVMKLKCCLDNLKASTVVYFFRRKKKKKKKIENVFVSWVGFWVKKEKKKKNFKN
jgi:hypothetical protein